MAELTVEKPKINEINKFTMFTPAPGVEGKNSRLAWCIRDGNPRVTVYTNIPSDASNMYGILSANMDPATFFMFLDLLEKTALGPSNVKHCISCKTSTRQSDGTYGDIRVMSKLLFGKDENGVVWISVIAENRPKIKFEFKVSDYHEFLKEDGTTLSESESSPLHALAVCRTMKMIYANLLSDFRQSRAAATGNTNNAAKPFSKANPPTSTLDFASIEDIPF